MFMKRVGIPIDVETSAKWMTIHNKHPVYLKTINIHNAITTTTCSKDIKNRVFGDIYNFHEQPSKENIFNRQNNFLVPFRFSEIVCFRLGFLDGECVIFNMSF